MSCCIARVQSSDQRAPGFWLALLWGFAVRVGLASAGGLRRATLSLSVGRGVWMSEAESELFMRI